MREKIQIGFFLIHMSFQKRYYKYLQQYAYYIRIRPLITLGC